MIQRWRKNYYGGPIGSHQHSFKWYHPMIRDLLWPPLPLDNVSSFRALIYKAHRAVIFATAQLSCFTEDRFTDSDTYFCNSLITFLLIWSLLLSVTIFLPCGRISRPCKLYRMDSLILILYTFLFCIFNKYICVASLDNFDKEYTRWTLCGLWSKCLQNYSQDQRMLVLTTKELQLCHLIMGQLLK